MTVVLCGASLLSPYGDGARGVLGALATDRTRASRRIPDAPAQGPAPDSQAILEAFYGRGARLAARAAATALHQAAVPHGAPGDGAVVVVTAGDWSEHDKYVHALGQENDLRTEPLRLFRNLDDQFFLGTFPWAIAPAVVGCAGFQGSHSTVDPPAFGGLAGLRLALDIIESGEAVRVLVVAVDIALRADLVTALRQRAHEHGVELVLGEAVIALVIEAEAHARGRDVELLARVDHCEARVATTVECALRATWAGTKMDDRVWAHGWSPAPAQTAHLIPASSETALGHLVCSGALVNAWLALQQEHDAPPRRVSTLAIERYWSTGAAAAQFTPLTPREWP